MYETLLDFLGDVRAPERLLVPPGGPTGDSAADSYLCILAERARCCADPIGYLRGNAARLSGQPVLTPSMETSLKRIADWCDGSRRDAA